MEPRTSGWSPSAFRVPVRRKGPARKTEKKMPVGSEDIQEGESSNAQKRNCFEETELTLRRAEGLCEQLNTGFAVDLLLSKAVLYVVSPHLDKHNACPSFCSHLLTLEGVASLCPAHCSAFHPCSRSPPFLPFLGTQGHPFSAMDLQPPSH